MQDSREQRGNNAGVPLQVDKQGVLDKWRQKKHILTCEGDAVLVREFDCFQNDVLLQLPLVQHALPVAVDEQALQVDLRVREEGPTTKPDLQALIPARRGPAGWLPQLPSAWPQGRRLSDVPHLRQGGAQVR